MSEKIKFTEEELKEILSLQNSYQQNLLKLGEHQIRSYMIEDEVNRLKQDEDMLKQEYIDIQNKESDLLNKITEKYGE